MARVSRKPVAHNREDDAPHDDLAERAVLGSILLDDARFPEVAAALDPSDFFTEKHRRIYARMRDLNARGDRIDRVLVAGELKKLGQLESVGGLNYLVSLDEQLPDVLNLDQYVRAVRKQSTLRKILKVSSSMVERVYLGEDPQEILAGGADWLRDLGAIYRADHHTVGLSGRGIYECIDPPVAAVVEDLLYPGFALLSGRPKCGKSWFALQLALAVARGDALAGWLTVPKPGRVLYLALEEPRKRTTARMRKLYRDGESVEALENIRFIYQIPPMMSGGLVELEAEIAEWHPVLVVIDTARAFMRLRTRNDVGIVQADYDAYSAVRSVAEKFENSIVCVDHTRKSGGDVIDTVNTTTGATAGVDGVLRLMRTQSGDSLLEGVGRDHEDLSYSMRFDNAPDRFGWEIYASGDDARNSAERQEILELLKHEAPLQPAKVALMLKKNANAVRTMMWRMATIGLIQKQRSGYVLTSL